MGRTKGSAPVLSINVNASNNRITTSGYSYDSTGNLTAAPFLTMTYDAENRMSQAAHSLNGTESYSYDPAGRRVWKQEPSRTLVYFYGVDGSLLKTYGDGNSDDYNVYFSGRQIWSEGAESPVILDRLGSTASWSGQAARYFPYGQEATSLGQYFATYPRESTTDLRYARNRYYSSTLARFTTPDPFGPSARPGNPQTWNRYTYVGGDPVNFNDPSGLGCRWVERPLRGLPYYACDFGLPGGSKNPAAQNMELLPELDAPWALMVATPPEGIATALQGLGVISRGGFKSKAPCSDFFAALIGVASLDISPDALMGQVATIAGVAASMEYVYDGPSSTTPLTPDKFPNAANPAAGINTVGDVFQQAPGLMALSQFDGAAIWINTTLWEGFGSPVRNWTNPSINSLGLGYLMHELLHKQMVGGGFDHDQMRDALRAAGAWSPGVGPNGIATSLANACF